MHGALQVWQAPGHPAKPEVVLPLAPSAKVAELTASLLLDDRGRLPDFDLHNCTIRGAVLIDLAIAGRLTQSADSVEIDPEITGVEPIDEMVRDLTERHTTINEQV